LGIVLRAEDEGPKDGAVATPDRANCHKAIKLLREYERLMKKYGKPLPRKRVLVLDGLRDAGTITSNDLPAKLRGEFPGEFTGMTIDAIRRKCGMKKS
jgi:hypothetical protein